MEQKNMATYQRQDIDDYQNRLTEEQAELLLAHCNKWQIAPDICAWYDDKEDFYQDWVYDNEICANKKEADARYREGLNEGEFKKFPSGEIVRLVI